MLQTLGSYAGRSYREGAAVPFELVWMLLDLYLFVLSEVCPSCYLLIVIQGSRELSTFDKPARRCGTPEKAHPTTPQNRWLQWQSHNYGTQAPSQHQVLYRSKHRTGPTSSAKAVRSHNKHIQEVQRLELLRYLRLLLLPQQWSSTLPWL